MKSRTIDIHTHILTEAMIAALQREVPKIAPHMKSIDADSALLEVAGTPYRPFLRGGWDELKARQHVSLTEATRDSFEALARDDTDRARVLADDLVDMAKTAQRKRR